MRHALRNAAVIFLAFLLMMVEVNTRFLSDLFAQDEGAIHVLTISEDIYEQKIQVETLQSDITRLAVLQNGNEVQSLTPTAGEPSEFSLKQNGDYEIVAYDSNQQILEKEAHHVECFQDLMMKVNDGNGLSLSFVSRKEGTSAISVHKDGNEFEAISVSADSLTYQKGDYTIQENGTYTFSAIDENKKTISNEVTHVVTSISLPKDTQEKGIQTILNESELQKIIVEPNGNYILGADIEMSAEMLTPYLNITFQGTLDGNGHVIKGMKQPLFASLQNATIIYLHLQGDILSDDDQLGAFAKQSIQSSISASSYQGTITAEKASAVGGFFASSDQSTITDSFMNAKIEAKGSIGGFYANGNATIKDSYVTGVLTSKENEVYGFGESGPIESSYLVATLKGKTTYLFHKEGELKGSFFDICLNEQDEKDAIGYTTEKITSGTLDTTFLQEKGSYPQIKEEVQTNWKEAAKKASKTSVIALGFQNNDNALYVSEEITLPKTSGEESITWKSEGNVVVDGTSAEVESSSAKSVKSGELSADVAGTKKYFMLRSAIPSGLKAGEIKAGVSSKSTTTSISFQATNLKYYLVVDQGTSVSEPKTHIEALDNGWVRKIGTGLNTITNLLWNHSYDVYETDLTTMSKLGSVTTNKGLAGGTITIDQSLITGTELTATLNDPTTTNGHWEWSYSSNMNGPWTSIRKDGDLEDNITSKLTLDDTLRGKYLKVEFTAKSGTDYENSVTYISDHRIAQTITDVTISGTEVLGNTLTASITPKECEDSVRYEWYRKSDGGDVLIYSGKKYKLSGDDVGHVLYVKAYALDNSSAIGGPLTSDDTGSIATKAYDEVTLIPSLSDHSDTTLTLQLPADANGLYQYAYAKSKSAAEGDRVIYPVTVRDDKKLVISGLEPNTVYFFWIRQVGENGYQDSIWSQEHITQAQTDLEKVKGELTLSGDTIVGKTLNVSAPAGITQTGDFSWYRVKGKTSTQITSADKKSSYTLTKDDAGYQIKVIYKGNGNYSGEISILSDTVQKKSTVAPNVTASVSDITDSSVKVKTPNESGKVYQIGYAKSESAAPILYKDASDKASFDPDTTIAITDLERYTDYYIFLRYAENDEEQASPWSSVHTPFQTTKTNLSSTSKVSFEVAGTLRQGDKLIARLSDPQDGLTGTWTWVKHFNGTDTPITAIFNEETGIGSFYQIPVDEDIGTTYTATFTANGGFEGSTKETSIDVKTIVLPPYDALSTAIKNSGSSDHSITVQVPSGNDGVYELKYGKQADGSDAQIWPYTTFAGTDIEIDGVSGNQAAVERNKTYYVWARRVGDGKEYSSSDWNASAVEIKTKTTKIAGTVSIDLEAVSGTKLTATYKSASYDPSGDDSKGSWQWYKGLPTLINGVDATTYEAISGATSNMYTPTSSDIGQILKVIYTGTGDFSGTKETVTKTVLRSSVSEAKKATGETEKDSSKNEVLYVDKVSLQITLDSGDYYQIRETGESLPTAPDLEDEAASLGWIKATSSSLTVDSYYDVTTKKSTKMKPNTQYTIYTVKSGTKITQASIITSSDSVKTGPYKQAGTISYVYSNSGKHLVVGDKVSAKLSSDSNNSKGKWYWYQTKKNVETSGEFTPNANTASEWTQISSGYFPTKDSDNSELSITEDMLGTYLRAEFVADEDQGYRGTIECIEGYVKMVYPEILELKATNNDKAYNGDTLTVTLKNGVTSNFTGRSVYFEVGTLDDKGVMTNVVQTNITPTTNSGTTFTLKLGTTDAWNDKDIVAYAGKPSGNKRLLYVDKDKKAVIDTTPLNTMSSTQTSTHYKSWVRIDTPEHLEALMVGTGEFANRDGNYVITNDINLNGRSAVTVVGANFTGQLDGDYHTIYEIHNMMFNQVYGTTTKHAIIKNIIFSGGTVGGFSRNSGVITGNGYHYELENLYMANVTVNGTHDTSFFIGDGGGDAILKNVGTAGGEISANTGNPSYSGIGGYMTRQNGLQIIENASFINTRFIYKGTGNPSECGLMSSGMNPAAGSYIKNTYSASAFEAEAAASKVPGNTNPLLGYVNGNAGNVKLTNNFYDYTILSPNWKDMSVTPSASNKYPLNTVADGTVVGPPKKYAFTDRGSGAIANSNPRYTSEMIGTDSDLSKAFGNEDWVYADGYYPRLKWISDNPITSLYAATRGAFTSLDATTSSADLFEGNISGAIQVPNEFQTSDFSFSSSDTGILNVTPNGSIIPVGAVGQSANVIVTYTNPVTKTTVSNNYTFTIKANGGQKSFSNLTVGSGGITPTIGVTLTAKATVTSGTLPNNITYKWYRRLNGTTDREPIKNASGVQFSGATYKIRKEDVGYQIMAVASSSGYGTISSQFIDPITLESPGRGPTTSEMTYNSVKLTGVAEDSEYAYALSESGAKTIVEDVGQSVTINNLQPNTRYYFFQRRAKGPGYEATAWSPATEANDGNNTNEVMTRRIQIVGDETNNNVMITNQVNVGQMITATVPETNFQLGTWKIERIVTNGGVDNYTDITAKGKVDANDSRKITYTLVSDDVNAKIRFTFTGNGDKGSNDDGKGDSTKGNFWSKVQNVTNTIQKATQLPPSIPVSTKDATDSSIYVKEPDTTSGINYGFGIQDGDGDIQMLSGTYAGNSEHEIKTGDALVSDTNAYLGSLTLKRNHSYKIYARKAETSGSVRSDWSQAVTIKTDQTSVTGSIASDIQDADKKEMVNRTLVFTAPADNNQTGTWTLERVDPTNPDKKTTLTEFTGQDTSSITYKLVPGDAGYQIKATFYGSGDFKGSLTTTSGTIDKDTYAAPASTPKITGQSDSSISVEVESGEGTYLFGYRLAGSGAAYEEFTTQASAGNAVAITGLIRNRSYEIVAKRASALGYYESTWSSPITSSTLKSDLAGNIRFEGTIAVNETIKAIYESGSYPKQPVDASSSDQGGTWQWYLDGAIISGETNESYVIKESDGSKTLSVIYTAKADSDFQSTRTSSAGIVGKKEYGVPDVPQVSATADAIKNSTITIDNPDTKVYYKIQEASITKLPTTVKESEAAANDWIQGSSGMKFTGLKPNTEYIIYAACLENDSHSSSQVVQSNVTRTLKEELEKEITLSADLKPMSTSKVSIDTYGKGPSGVWNWYASQTSDASAKWILLRSESVDESSSAVSDTYDIPFQYSGYYMRIVFEATGDYTGSKEYIMSTPLDGKPMSGTVSIDSQSDLTNTPRLLQPMKAVYNGSDETSGVWTWYIEDAKGSDTYVKIDDSYYGKSGVESIYTPQEKDLGKKLYAIYTAKSPAYSGESTSAKTNAVIKAVQTTPNAPNIVQINGNQIQVSDDATYGSVNEKPKVQYGYKEQNSAGGIVWQMNDKIGESWFTGLKTNTTYEFYSRYLETSIYEQSNDSPVQTATTQEMSFFIKDLDITYPSGADTVLNVGDAIVGTYDGEGYEEGTWSVIRSNGDVILSEQAGSIQSNKNTFQYKPTLDDAGSKIILRFTAKDGAIHSGYIEKESKTVVKPQPTDKAVKPILKGDLDTNFFITNVQDDQEYAIVKEQTEPGRNSSLWMALVKDANGAYEYTGLDRDQTYYIYTRIAETTNYDVSDAVVSDFIKTLPYVDLGEITLNNETDQTKQPMGTSNKITIPSTMKQIGTLSLRDITMERVADKRMITQPNASYHDFVNSDGNIHLNVYEKGSTWGDDNYASLVSIRSKDLSTLRSDNKDSNSITFADKDDQLDLSMYRVNAVSEGGDYVWEAYLEDVDGNSALLHALVHVNTQMKATAQIKVDLKRDERMISQRGNTNYFRNDQLMPLVVGVDEHTEKGTSMPELNGIYQKTLNDLADKNEVYLKITTDGSDYRDQNGIWFTTAQGSSLHSLALLGARGRIDYMVSGITSKQVDWPWVDEGDKRWIAQAYKMRFYYEIGKEDHVIYGSRSEMK